MRLPGPRLMAEHQVKLEAMDAGMPDGEIQMEKDKVKTILWTLMDSSWIHSDSHISVSTLFFCVFQGTGMWKNLMFAYPFRGFCWKFPERFLSFQSPVVFMVLLICKDLQIFISSWCFWWIFVINRWFSCVFWLDVIFSKIFEEKPRHGFVQIHVHFLLASTVLSWILWVNHSNITRPHFR